MPRPKKPAGVHLILTPKAAACLRSALLALERHLGSGLAMTISSAEAYVVCEATRALGQEPLDPPLVIAVPEDL